MACVLRRNEGFIKDMEVNLLRRKCTLPVTLSVVCWSAITGCDRAPPEPTPPTVLQEAPDMVSSGGSSAPGPSARGSGGVARSGGVTQVGCLQPLAEQAPSAATSLESCPADPDGRPIMPRGTIRFEQAPNAPELTVELALNLDHQRHGLMFRSHLADTEGMLFSYEGDKARHFWMHNTCLALDMLHIDQENRIVGIVEQVPPWNDATRSIRCDAKHVLEVPAGWSRRYGVFPGQTVKILTPEPTQ